MTPLEKHRATLYGRIGASVVLFLGATIFAAVQALTAGMGRSPLLVGGMLIAAVVVLPRRASPRSEEVREEADDEELEFYKDVRQWLTWSRIAYLVIALLVFFGLPELVG